VSKQIIAIGGGGFGRNPDQCVIEQYILDQSTVENPKICFIPTATGDDDLYKLNFYVTFSRLKCQPSHLDFFKRTVNLKKLIHTQDIIFVGGGNTRSMLAVWREWGLDGILKEAYEKGVVLSGVSAGAICWFERGVTDSWDNKLSIMDCLGYIEGVCCPHYDEEKERRPSLHRFLKEKVISSAYGIDGECALHFIDGSPAKTIIFGQKKNAYSVKIQDNKVVESSVHDRSFILGQ
tara:strand:- start:45786 stop:46490 length:705 start_codon:yes stop_codon:yes gene_type:complete